jgi:hypothetical protein
MYGLAAAPALRSEPRLDGRPTGVPTSILSRLRRLVGAVTASAPDASGLRHRRVRALLVAAILTGVIASIPVATPGPDTTSGAAGLGRAGRRLSAGLSGGGLRSAARVAGQVPLQGASVYMGADGETITTERIRRFLARQGSPMARYAANILTAGIRYRVDPRVVVAISGVESTYGLYSYGHNAWGWGSQRWRSWPASIDGYTQALSQRYRSLRTGRFAAASRTYCPPCGARWGIKALQIFRTI